MRVTICVFHEIHKIIQTELRLLHNKQILIVHPQKQLKTFDVYVNQSFISYNWRFLRLANAIACDILAPSGWLAHVRYYVQSHLGLIH